MKKIFVPNFRLILFLIATAFFIFGSVLFLSTNGAEEKDMLDKLMSVLWPLFSAFFVFFTFVMAPCGFVFDEEGVRIYYLFFLLKRSGKWSEIQMITTKHSRRGMYSYYLYGLKGRLPRFMMNEIPKNFITKRLIEKFWHGKIDGYEFSIPRK